MCASVQGPPTPLCVGSSSMWSAVTLYARCRQAWCKHAQHPLTALLMLWLGLSSCLCFLFCSACSDRKKLPFFLYIYIDSDIVVGRGRGGGLAVWTRADKVRFTRSLHPLHLWIAAGGGLTCVHVRACGCRYLQDWEARAGVLQVYK